jgi:CPA2 family monovalent cation:H+ antiporter-2
MLFNHAVLIEQPLRVLAVVAIIVIGKSIAAFVLVLAFRYPLKSALIVSASLAQIGEFSFILTEMGISLGVFPVEGRSLILAGALISIAINPLLFKLIDPIYRWIQSSKKLSGIFERASDPLAELPTRIKEHQMSGQVVVVGYGRVGKHLVDLFSENPIPYVVIDENRQLIQYLRASCIPAVYGDASDPSVLIESHISRASILMIVIPDLLRARKIIYHAQKLNADIEIVICLHNEEAAKLLQKNLTGKVFFAEGEVAKNMGIYVLNQYGKYTLS